MIEAVIAAYLAVAFTVIAIWAACKDDFVLTWWSVVYVWGFSIASIWWGVQ